jgi:uncharacterized protein HemX
MNKKTILLGALGLAVVAGIGFYFWNKSKNTSNTENKDAKKNDNTKVVDEKSKATIETPKASDAEIQELKNKLDACNKKYANIRVAGGVHPCASLKEQYNLLTKK